MSTEGNRAAAQGFPRRRPVDEALAASAFGGCRIVDFTQGIAGPMACMLLADFGADVVKVEPPVGDRLQQHPGYVTWNRNKSRVVLDLARYEGLRVARELLATADVAVFDARPGELERTGLDAVTLGATNPALLHAWLPPYGTRGRWSQLPPDDGLLAAVSGVSFMQLSYADVPIHLVTPQVSYAQAMIAASAISAGLFERDRSGRGQALTVSGLHAVSAIESGAAILAGDVLRLGSNSSRGGVPHYQLYQCSDGEWFFLGTLTPQFFIKALDAIDLLGVLTMEGIEGEFTNLFLPANVSRVVDRLDARFAEKPRAEWLRILHEHGVPCGPVGTREDWFHGETISANGMRVELHHETLGRVEMPGVSVELSRTPGSVRHLLKDRTPEEVASHIPVVLPGAPPDPATAVPATGPLRGVRVLDLGAFIAGTFAPTVLANFGADVVKIEPFDGDPFRTYGLLFIGNNRGKRCLAIDLKHPRGLETFYEMVRQADVVLDNYRLGVRERLGIDYATLSRINPRIIACSVTAYGPVGSLANDPGFDPIVQARSGMMAAQGGNDEPVFHQIAVNDTATAIMAAFGIIAALYARERTGLGQEVQTCLANQSILCQSGELTWYEGRPLNPVGSLDCVGVSALQRFYQCADGWIAVAGSSSKHFEDVCAALGHDEWTSRWTPEQALREAREGPLAESIATALAQLPGSEALDRLLVRGVPAAPAATVKDVFSDPWLAENGFLEGYEHPQHGPVLGVRTYADWTRTPGGFPRRAPLLGEHTSEVLRDFGFDDERVEALIAEGVVKQG